MEEFDWERFDEGSGFSVNEVVEEGGQGKGRRLGFGSWVVDEVDTES